MAITTTITAAHPNGFPNNTSFQLKRTRVELDALDWMVLNVAQRPREAAESTALAGSSAPCPSVDFMERIEPLIETVAERLKHQLPEKTIGIYPKRTLVDRLGRIISKWKALLTEADIAILAASSSFMGGALPIASELLAGEKRAARIEAAAKSKTNGSGGSTGDASPSCTSSSSGNNSSNNSNSNSSSSEEMVKAVGEPRNETSLGKKEIIAPLLASNPLQSTEPSNSASSSSTSYMDSSDLTNYVTLPTRLDETLSDEDFQILFDMMQVKSNIELLLEVRPLSNGKLISAFMKLFKLVGAFGKGDDESLKALRNRWKEVELVLFSRYRELVHQLTGAAATSSSASLMSTADRTSSSLSSLSLSLSSMMSLACPQKRFQRKQLFLSSSVSTTVEDSTITISSSNDNDNLELVDSTDLEASSSSSSSSSQPVFFPTSPSSSTSSISETLNALDRSISLFFALHCPSPNVVQRKIVQLERHVQAIPPSMQTLAAHWQDKLAEIWQQFRLLSPAVSSADEGEGENSVRSTDLNQNLAAPKMAEKHIKGISSSSSHNSSELSEGVGGGGGGQGILNSTTTSAVENGGGISSYKTGSNAHLTSNITVNGSSSSSRSGLQGQMEADLRALEATIEADITAGDEKAAINGIEDLIRLVETLALEDIEWAVKVASLIHRSMKMTPQQSPQSLANKTT